MGVDFLNGWDAMIATSQANINQALILAYKANLLPHDITATRPRKPRAFQAGDEWAFLMRGMERGKNS